MALNNHDWIDFLKVDIEGAEYEMLKELLSAKEALPFGHFNVEFHLSGNEKNEFTLVNKLWKAMYLSGLRAHTYEINVYAGVRKPLFVEYAFLNIHSNFLSTCL